MTIPSPFDDAETWDTLVLGGARYRGTFEWGGDLIKRKLDRRHAAGRDGARVRDKGYDLAELDLTLTVTNSEEWEDLQAIIGMVFPRAATPGSRNALTCAHPALALAGVTKLYGTSMGPLNQASPTKWTVRIKLVEYRDPPPGGTSVSRTPRPAPDIGANRTAFTGTEPAPAPTAPPTPGPSAP